MDYQRAESIQLLIRNVSALYQKQQYTSVILLLQPYVEDKNSRIQQILIKSYYNLKMFVEAHSLCQQILESKKEFEAETRISLLYLLTLCQYQLNLQTKTKHKDQLSKVLNINIDWDSIRKQRPKAKELRKNIEKIMQEQENFKYFSESQLPVYLIPISWFSRLEQGKVEPINSLDILQCNEYMDTQKACLHYNYILKQHLMQYQDYKIVGANTWKYISDNIGGTQIKRYTIKINNTVMVQSKFRVLKILCVTSNKVKQLNIPVSRIQSISQLKDRLKKILIRFNLIDKQVIISTRNAKLIHIKNTPDTALLTKLIYSSSGAIIDFPCYQLNDQLTIVETQILPKQLLIFELSKTELFHSQKLQSTVFTSQRCFVCSSEDPSIVCECKTVRYCSNKCKSNNNKHQEACKAILKQKTGLKYLINAFEIDQNSEVPKNLKSNTTGLENIGNTCFLNAAMQCIIGIDKLSEYFLKNSHLKDINFRNPLGSEGKLACAYGQFLKEIYFTKKRAIEPRLLKRIVEKKNSTFSGYQQQDSQQFLSYFLDLLHQDLNKVKDKPTVQNIESDGRPDNVIAKITLQNYHKRNKSIITDLMMGQYRSQLQCPDCGKISITFDPYMTVTLPLPNKRNRLQLQGYFVHKNGYIQKVQQKVSNRGVGEILNNFKIRSCHAMIVKKQISKIFPDNQPMQTITNANSILFLYQIGDQTDVEFHFQILDSQTDELLSFTRRIFSNVITSQSQLLNFAYNCLIEPFTKAFNIRKDRQQYLKYCNDNQLLQLHKNANYKFPIRNGVHQLKVYMKSSLKSKVKFNVSTGSVELAESEGQLTIPNLLRNFSIPQKLTEQNSWYCSVCKKHQLATKKLSLYSVPQYLILHLKRFSNKIHGRYVYNQKIDTPLKLNQIQQINGRKYELYGIVNHMGTMSGGHYTSFVKRDEWLYFDDERCKRVQLTGIYAYLLFYKVIPE